MLVVNDVDTRAITLRITDSRSTNVRHTLKSNLLENAKNYTLITRKATTNSVPPLFHEDKVLFVIAVKDAQGFAFDDTDTPMIEMYDAAPQYGVKLEQGNHHNILGLVNYISEHVKDINRYLNIHGPGAIDATVPDANVIHEEFAVDPHICFSLDGCGRAVFQCSEEFLSTFYIHMDPYAAALLGLSRFIFGGEDANGGFVTSDGVDMAQPDILGDLQFEYDVNFELPLGVLFKNFVSARPIYLLDERESLDIEMTLPLSRTIDVHDEAVKETYRLASYPIQKFIKSTSALRTVRGGSLGNQMHVEDSLQGGVVELSRKGQTISHLLPGQIRAINVRLFCSYLTWARKRVEQPYTLDGYWDLELLFLKKVT